MATRSSIPAPVHRPNAASKSNAVTKTITRPKANTAVKSSGAVKSSRASPTANGAHATNGTHATNGIASSSASASNADTQSAIDIMSTFKLMELKQITLPTVCQYLSTTYDFNITADELAEQAFQLPAGDFSFGSVKASRPSSKKEIDEENGCQFILKRSVERPNRPCGLKCNANSYFCKACVKKKSFGDIVREVSVLLSVPMEELMAGLNYDIPMSSPMMGGRGKPPGGPPGSRGPGPAQRGAHNGPLSRGGPAPRGASSVRGPPGPPQRGGPQRAPPLSSPAQSQPQPSPYRQTTRNTPQPPPPAQEPEEEALSLTEFEGLENILLESTHGIVVYNADDGVTIAFGTYNAEEDKIYPLDENGQKMAESWGFDIGDYHDYNLGDRAGVEQIDQTEQTEQTEQPDAGEEQTEEKAE